MDIKPKAFNPYQWYWYQKKRGMHEEAIKEVLGIIKSNKPQNPWAYGNKVINIKSGNYYERDYRVRHESVKEGREEFKIWLEDSNMSHLVRGIG